MNEPAPRLVHVRWTLTGTDAAAFRRKIASGNSFKHMQRELRCQFPRRTRLRLWATDHINAIGIWLVERDHCGAAVALWRLCGMWKL